VVPLEGGQVRGYRSRVPPLIAFLDAYQSSFQIWYVSNILRKRRMCKKYLEGKEIN
jgi:hypothetical protein